MTNIHSYCALFLRQRGGPSERLLLNPEAAARDRFQYLQQRWHASVLRTAWLKATCYTLSLTHTQSCKHAHTDHHKSSDAEAAMTPPLVVWCELSLNLINHQTLPLTNSAVSLVLPNLKFSDIMKKNKLIHKPKCPNSSVNTNRLIVLALLAAPLGN